MIEPWFKLTWFDFRLSINIKNSIIIIKTRVVPQLWSIVCSICIHGNKMDFFFFPRNLRLFPTSYSISFAMWKWASLYPESTGLDLAEIPVTKAALPDYGSIQILFFCQIRLFRAPASACAFPTGNSSGKDYCFFLVIRASRIIGRCLWVLTLLQQLLTCSHSQQWKML